MGMLHVSLFQKLEVTAGDRHLFGLEGCKAQELFAYLLVFRDRAHPREALADLLWETTSTSQSRSYLRKALWQIQSAMEGLAPPGGQPLFLVEPEWVQLDPEASLWLDVEVFERAFAQVKGRPGWSLDGQQVEALHQATGVYRGDLLEGWYQEWCLYERQRLQHIYLLMMEKLLAYCEAHGGYEAGLGFAAQILRYDRARERTHRRLMRLHYLAGDRTAALRHYERCVAALDEELGVKPARRTVELYEQIRDDRLEDAVWAEPAPGQPAALGLAARQPGSMLLPAVLARLRQLHGLLSEADDQVQQDIRIVEAALTSSPSLRAK